MEERTLFDKVYFIFFSSFSSGLLAPPPDGRAPPTNGAGRDGGNGGGGGAACEVIFYTIFLVKNDTYFFPGLQRESDWSPPGQSLLPTGEEALEHKRQGN